MGWLKVLLRRHVGVYLAVGTVFLFGYISLKAMPLSYYPKFSAPVLFVTTAYPGASAEDVEETVTEPVEEALAGLDSVDEIRSETRDGFSRVVVTFEWGTDLDRAKADAADRLNKIRGRLPRRATNPSVLDVQSFLPPAMELALVGPDLDALRDLAVDLFKPRLEQLSTVGSVTVAGGADEVVRIRVRPAELERRGLSLGQVIRALSGRRTDLPAGRVDTPSGNVVDVRVHRAARSIRELEDIVVALSHGVPVRLGDLAEVRVARKEAESIARVGGRPAVLIRVYGKSDGNTVALCDQVRDVLGDLRAVLPPGSKLLVAQDGSKYIRLALRNVGTAGVIGAALASVILGLFIGSLRASLVVSLSIPLAVMATFVLMKVFGLTLNTVSLGGLAIGVGMIVDASVVVAENVLRRYRGEQGEALEEEMASSVKEVAAAVFASILTSIVVFLPLAFLQGLAAVLLGELALTVVFALVASVVVALTVIPVLQFRILSRRGMGRRGRGHWMDGVRRGYERALGLVLRHRGLVLLAAFAGSIATCSLGRKLRHEMLPVPDSGEFFVELDLPQGTGLDATDRAVTEVEKLLRKNPAVEQYTASVGVSGPIGDVSPRSARMRVVLNLDRAGGLEGVQHLMTQVRSRLTVLFPEAKVKVKQRDPAEGMKRPPVDLRILGPDLEVLRRLGDRAAALVRKVPGAAEVSTSLGARQPALLVDLRPAWAARSGLDEAAVADAARAAVAGIPVGEVSLQGRRVDMEVRWDRDLHVPEAVSWLWIFRRQGPPAFLKGVADLHMVPGPAVIHRYHRSRAVRVTAEAPPKLKGKVAARARAAVARGLELPPGYRIEWAGASRAIKRSFKTMGIALLVGLLLVFVVMATQFNSFSRPFVILLTVPLAVAGAVAGLVAADQAANLNSLLGILILLGIAVNNGILLVDFMDQQRRAGLAPIEAVVRGAGLRLRPVLVTSLTTMGGMLPLALGLGEGSGPLIPLGVSVLGGMLVSTLFTLFVVPAAYAFLFCRSSHR